MVEFHATPSVARGWSPLSFASREKRFQLPHGTIRCAIDFLTIFALPLLGSLLCHNTESLTKNLYFWSLLSLLSVLLTASHGGYGPTARDRPKAQLGVAANCFLATSLAMLTLAAVLGHPNILTRRWVALDMVATPLLLAGARTLLAPKLAGGSYNHSEPGPLVVCGDLCPAALRKALASKNLPDRIAGVLYLTDPHEAALHHGWPVLPDLASLRVKLRSGRIRDVIFIYHPELYDIKTNINHILWEEILTSPASIWLAFDVASSLPEVLQEKSGGYRLVPLVTDEFLSSNNFLKRIFDVVAATLLLVVFSPLMVICPLLIRIGSPGPAFFRQLRIGAHGHQFEVLKFRTMSHDPGRPFMQACPDDPRITRVGNLLRRSSLDELPQLINVLRGDMSLVGPRPHAPETQVEGISFESALRLYQIRHRVKPGITGLAQIRGLRGATPVLKNLELRLASDLEYIQSWSLWLDLSILMQTLPAVLMQTNAG